MKYCCTGLGGRPEEFEAESEQEAAKLFHESNCLDDDTVVTVYKQASRYKIKYPNVRIVKI